MIRTLALVLSIVTFALVSSRAWAIDRTFSGSAQVDYFFVPTEKGANARAIGFDGFTTELSLKTAVDFSDHLSATVKVCYGCHGFEADMAYVDYRFSDAIGIRLGRFSPTFGNFNLRHDPANHGLSDKPLPYDMGRMLRRTTWNNGVLPSPFPDNGVELGGTKWFGEGVQFDYAAYAVAGFKADPKALDLDFTQSRQPYYVDNNGRPSVGARTALTLRLAETSDLTMGASAMYGTYDPDNRLTYAIVGADVALRLGSTNLRAEYLVRREQFDVSDPTRFKYAIAPERGDFFAKHGAYLELEQPVSARVGLLARVDGLYRVGNVATVSELSYRSSVSRFTLGTTIAVERGLRVKASTELWKFSDDDAGGRSVAVGMHLSAVGSF